MACFSSHTLGTCAAVVDSHSLLLARSALQPAAPFLEMPSNGQQQTTPHPPPTPTAKNTARRHHRKRRSTMHPIRSCLAIDLDRDLSCWSIDSGPISRSLAFRESPTTFTWAAREAFERTHHHSSDATRSKMDCCGCGYGCWGPRSHPCQSTTQGCWRWRPQCPACSVDSREGLGLVGGVVWDQSSKWIAGTYPCGPSCDD